MEKEKLIAQVIDYLRGELSTTLQAAENAHLAAIDDQSVAETQYDTLAIEASYLAEGQSRRVQEIKEAIRIFEQLKITAFTENTPIDIGAFVQLQKDQNTKKIFFIAPAAGGYRSNNLNYNYTIITPQSPMGMALMGKYQDDELELALAVVKSIDLISLVC